MLRVIGKMNDTNTVVAKAVKYLVRPQLFHYLNNYVSFPYIHGELIIDCGNKFQSLITLLLDVVYELCDNIIV